MVDINTEFKELLKDGNCKKDFYIYVEYLEGETRKPYFPVWYDVITTSYLVSESVKFDERLCSESTIKFGLCEGTSLEFEYFDKPNIKGRTVKINMVIYDHDAGSQYIDMGYFTVDTVSKQASTGIYKVTAYNKLKSKYLDEKANSLIANISDDGIDDNELLVFTTLSGLLNDYTIEEAITEQPTAINGYHAFYADVPTVKLKNDSANYSLHYNSGNTTGELQARSKIVCVKDIQDYCSYVISAIDEFKQWIDDNFQNSETIWNNYIRDVCLLGCFPVMYRRGPLSEDEKVYTAYVPSKYIYSDTITHGGTTFKIRKLESLCTINNAAYSLDDYSLNFRVFTNARVLDSNLDLVKEWNFSNTSGFTSDLFHFYIMDNLSNAEKVVLDKSTLSDVTLRELQSAVYETECLYGKLDRETDLFSGVELNQTRLYPAETLYPANTRYPGGAALSTQKAMYSKLWADEDNVQKWRYLIITYLGTDDQEHKLQRTVDEHGTVNYNCSDNWLFRNLKWTAEQIRAYADAMVAKMQDITWFPFEMWCAGLPYLETGDEIEINIGENSYVSYILQRNLSGIQNLQDTFINGELDIF